MKKIILVIVIFILSVFPVLASEGEGHHGHAYGHYKFKKVINNTTNIYKTENNITEVTEISNGQIKNIYGAKLDAPNLIRLADNWYIGAEGGKDFNQTDANEGWFAYGKVTYSGTWFDFRKK